MTTLQPEDSLRTLADTWAKRLVRVLVAGFIVGVEVVWLGALVAVGVWLLFLR